MPALTPVLRTERLILRDLEEQDSPALAAMMAPEVAQWLAAWPSPCSSAQALAKIRSLRVAAAARAAVPLAIVDARAGAVIGMVSFVTCAAPPPRAEMSYWLGPGHQGRGYMREALSAALPPAFARLDVDVIEGGGQAEDGATFAVMKALGFTRIGDRMVYAESRGVEELCIYYALRRSDQGPAVAPGIG